MRSTLTFVIIFLTFTFLLLYQVVYSSEQTKNFGILSSELDELKKEHYELLLKNEQLIEENDKIKKENESLVEENIKFKKDLEAKLKKEKYIDRKIAFLTFDDGPSPNTTRILDILKEHNIKATFFVNGREDDFSIEAYKRIVEEGHSIGNHSYSHDYSVIYRSIDTYLESHYRLEELLYETTGIRTKLVRFPGGSNNTISRRYGGKGLMEEIVEYLNEKGYVYFDWNVDSRDASVALSPKNQIVSSVLRNSEGQKIVNVLMHDGFGKHTTVDALPEIIEGLNRMGFEYEPLTKYSPVHQFLTVN